MARSCAMATLHSITLSELPLSPKRCTSKPEPVRGNRGGVMAKSSSVVSLMFCASPSMMHTRNPACSATAASSVMPCGAALWAFKSLVKSNNCGVCARYSPSRGTVSIISPLTAFLSVSVTGRAGITPSVSAKLSKHRAIKALETKGRAASWINTRCGCPSASAFSPFKTDAWRLSPPNI